MAEGNGPQAALWKLARDYGDELHGSTLVLPDNMFALKFLSKMNLAHVDFEIGEHPLWY